MKIPTFSLTALVITGIALVPVGNCEELKISQVKAINFGGETKQSNGCVRTDTFTNVGEWTYYESINYPNSYANNLDCRYYATSPKGTQITMECDDFNVENSTNCVYDVFYWSLTGDSQFRDSKFACGKGSLTPKKTFGNKLAIGFRSDASNPQGDVYRFSCKISVVPTPCSCGVSGATSRIVGGTQAKIAEFPWRVALYSQESGLFCSGSLISNNWVMTAAHCTNSLASGEQVYADIGDHDLSSPNEANNQVILVDRIMQNSLYNDQTQDSDIALLHLSRPVLYAKNIQPICLPWKYTYANFDRQVATASGWGTDSAGGSQSSVLMKVDLDVQNTQTCRNSYANHPDPQVRKRNVQITNQQFCAYREGKDTCQGDSGGSLDYKDFYGGNYYGIGIASYGFGCAQKYTPGIYTQVVNYLGWIEQNTGETFCKA